LKCPSCGSADSHVLDSRHVEEGNSIRRRRACAECGRRFTTYEAIETVPIMVIKKDGSREFFDRHKLKMGILHACQKRPVDVEAIVCAIEKELQNSLVAEIPARELGEMVMEHLREVDAVSYVRFASVYREFKDVDTFLSELNKMIRGSSLLSSRPEKGRKKESDDD
jgi:transcriptional repressor NrdR